MKKKISGIILLIAGLSLAAQAQITSTYANASGNWSVATNWTPNTVPNGAGDVAVLSRNIGVQNKNITNDISVTLGGLTIGQTANNPRSQTLVS
ncbi:MAG: hypothetical protein WC701_08735 [Kiritimatiellales bacterium]|jgi:hypothetical protein